MNREPTHHELDEMTERAKQAPKMQFSEVLSILAQFEYSSDGFPKRYPEQKDYDAAMAALAEHMDKQGI